MLFASSNRDFWDSEPDRSPSAAVREDVTRQYSLSC